MRFTKHQRWGPLMLAIALAALALPAQAAITPESDVLLPFFEIEIEQHEVGLSTTFTIVNASPNSVRSLFTVYTNWGIPVLEVPVEFKRAEAITIDLTAWIAHGQLPDRQLALGELAHLHAALTGKPSPNDGLYYSTPFKEGMAVGYVIVQTLNDRPDSLWGDTHNVEVGQNYLSAETLVALTHGLKADCSRHGLRFMNEGRMFEGDELIIWSGRRFEPSPTPNPIGPKMKIKASIYDQSGHHVQDCERELIAVDSIMVCHLDVTPPVGWLDITTEDPTVILKHLHSTTIASAALHSYCLTSALKIEGPGIAIEKRVLGSDADKPKGPKVKVGDPLEFQYEIMNTGTVPLTAVTVTDDQIDNVTCPKSTLAAGESMICTAVDIAKSCLNANIGTVTGAAPNGTRVGANDPAYYYGGYESAVTLETLVNDSEADDPTGPFIDAGAPLHWTFIVTNSGNAPLKELSVARKNGEIATCPKSELAPGESMTCSAESVALEGQQHEVGSVNGNDPCGDRVKANDPAYYFGKIKAPSIEIRKFAGESDANTPPGPALEVGTTVQWRFLVTNTGNITLTGIVVTDDQGITPECPKTTLEPGESMTCFASSVVLPCQQANIATATGTWGDKREQTVSAQDPAHYFGTGHPAVALELKVNGEPADTPPGPWIDENATVLFTYEVTNTGDVALTGLFVNDDRDRTAFCPKAALQPGESMTCTASTLAAVGTWDVIGTVRGSPPCGDAVTAADPAYYRVKGLAPSIDLVKLTNQIHADTPPGPEADMGSTVTWSYIVTNTGNVALTGISVVDSGEVAVSCPKTALEPGESMTCTASGIAQACQYTNTATATGRPPAGENVTASDTGYYFGKHNAAIAIDKKTNGEDALTPPGPSITAGTSVTWTYLVTNTGNIALTNVSVTDDRAGAVPCPKSVLAAGESMTCTASGTALAGPQQNVGTASGTPPCGNAVTASDPSHYLGVTPGISIEKLINGEDADDSTHAVVLVVGTPVLWSFVVTNTGDVGLSDISVTDNTLPTITCPKTTLAPGESMTCTASGIAEPGLDCDIGKAVGTSPQGALVESIDTACYKGETASISIEKKTNGVDADTPPGPNITVGAAVQWTYVVTNTGTLQLTSVSVTDNRGVTVTCPKTVLAPGESMTCTASGTAVEGQYANIGTATGTPPTGTAVTASDPSHYNGVPETGNQGCTPGYWKNHTDSWPPAGYAPSQTLLSVYSEMWRYTAASSTLLQALGFAGGSGVDGAMEILMRAAVAALLNAAHPGVAYPRTLASILTDVNTALASGNRDAMLALAAALDADNNRGCPLN